MKKLFYLFVSIVFILTLQIPLTAQTSISSNSHITAFGCGLLEGGYSSKLSLYQGDSLDFYISTNANPFTLRIYRYGKAKEFVTEINNLPGGIRNVKESDSAYINGCRWPASLKGFRIPEGWKAGAYVAEFPVSSDSVNPVLFFVKERSPEKRSKVIVACATNTYQSYNMFGGKSSYPAYSSGGNDGTNFSPKLSFNRPFNSNNHMGINRGSFFSFDAKLIRWLEETGYGKGVDVVSDADLDSDPTYLNTHKVLLVCGHNEYWSWRMRENVETFINNGNHFMCLSGNTCWWQIRYEDNYRTFVCYKHMEDPVSNPLLTTHEWINIRRENNFIGTSYENGGQTNYGNNPGCLNNSSGFGSYIIYNSQHWVFNNTGLHDGDTLGWRGDSSIVGYESDAALFRFEDGLPVVTGVDETPLNFRILGISPANHTSENKPKEWATMGIFKHKKPGAGYVFNAATIRWVWGLYSKESKVSIVTKNVLDHFLQDKFPPEVTNWSNSTIKNENRFGLPLTFNSRLKELQAGDDIMLKAEAQDHDSSAIKYAWAINDSSLSLTDNFLLFRSHQRRMGDYKITLFAFNSVDTVSIDWLIKITARTLSITSIPDTVIHIGKPYKYRISYSCKLNDPVSYTVNYLPRWASYNSADNSVEGIPDCEKDSVSISVEDLHGNKDTQSFKLSASGDNSKDEDSKPVYSYSLGQNYPNPFNPATRINYSLAENSRVKLKVYDMLGSEVAVVVDEFQAAGSYSVQFNAGRLSSGVYIYKLEAGQFKQTRKLVLTK